MAPHVGECNATTGFIGLSVDHLFDKPGRRDVPGYSVGFVVHRGESPVPEPSTWAMMLLGFSGLGFAAYRASRKTATSSE